MVRYLLIGLFLAAGCSSPQVGACATTTQCASGMFCVSGKCTTAQCTVDSDCANAQTCSNNACVASHTTTGSSTGGSSASPTINAVSINSDGTLTLAGTGLDTVTGATATLEGSSSPITLALGAATSTTLQVGAATASAISFAAGSIYDFAVSTANAQSSGPFPVQFTASGGGTTYAQGNGIAISTDGLNTISVSAPIATPITSQAAFVAGGATFTSVPDISVPIIAASNVVGHSVVVVENTAATGDGAGVSATVNGGGNAIYGVASASSLSNAYGVEGSAESSGSVGVAATNTSGGTALVVLKGGVDFSKAASVQIPVAPGSGTTSTQAGVLYFSGNVTPACTADKRGLITVSAGSNPAGTQTQDFLCFCGEIANVGGVGYQWSCLSPP